MIRSGYRHSRRLYMAWNAKISRKKTAAYPVRGYMRQEKRRAAERELKKGALTFCRWMRMYRKSPEEIACMIGVTKSTLYRWEHKWKKERLHPAGRGRPCRRACSYEEELIKAEIKRLGPGIGVSVLQGQFPHISRRELRYHLHEYRRQWVHERILELETIQWNRPGAVWAVDYTEPPAPMDGLYRYIFAVRDLASGNQLMNLPSEKANGKTTADALKSLIQEHGAPLVIKSDNGSALTNKEVSELLEEKKIKKLLSPPGYPWYNGAIEAGIGSMKTRAHHESARNNRPGEWTCDDVEAARLQANMTARPKGAKGPTPHEMWEKRKKTSTRERDDFLKTCERIRKEMLEECTQGSESISKLEIAHLERRSVERALKEHGYFVTGRRRIIPPIFRKICRRIS
jgi:transposase InsO family protein